MQNEDGYYQVLTFLIDNGELEGLAPEKCFVLGYEFAVIKELVSPRSYRDDFREAVAHSETPEHMAHAFHTINTDRVKSIMQFFEITDYTINPINETWSEVVWR